jgi:hypothetical protein
VRCPLHRERLGDASGMQQFGTISNMFADAPIPCDYSQQLTHIAQALDQPHTPVWIVSLISASLGAFAGVVSEPLKEQVKTYAAILQVRSELRATIARNEVRIRTLRFIIDRVPSTSFLIPILLVRTHIHIEQIAHILETKKELLFRDGQYENLKKLCETLQVVKNTMTSTVEIRKTLSEAVKSADISIRYGSVRRLRGLRYRMRMREEFDEVEKELRAFAKDYLARNGPRFAVVEKVSRCLTVNVGTIICHCVNPLERDTPRSGCAYILISAHDRSVKMAHFVESRHGRCWKGNLPLRLDSANSIKYIIALGDNSPGRVVSRDLVIDVQALASL